MFSKYFTDKNAYIRSRFVNKDVNCHVAEQLFFFLQYIAMFYTYYYTGEVRTIILKCPNKSRDLDPFPIYLLKRCIKTTINMSMQDGVVPDDFNQALVNPLIKKQNLGKMN